MAYTRPWDETVPDGSIVDAEFIDDEIRALKLDIRERMDTVLGSSQWDNDPVATLTARKRLVGAVNSFASNPTLARTGAGLWIEPSAVTTTVALSSAIAEIVRAGGIINSITLYCYRDAGATVSLTLYRVPVATGGQVVVATVGSAATGWHSISIAPAYTVLDTELPVVNISLTSDGVAANSARALAFLIDYDITSLNANV